jgi:arylsulfatase A-like enzyme
MVESVDDSLGRILDTLEQLKISDQTLVIFTSDNGGLASQSDCSPLRAGKGSAYEGGVRVPFIVRWPQKIPAGKVSDVPVCSIDLYPTIIEATKVKDHPDHIADGVSLLPVLTETGPLPRDAIYWHYPHYHPGGATPYSAIRSGNYRLVEFFEDHHIELYDLEKDVSEKNDLVKSQPDIAKGLHEKLQNWRQAVGAQLPTKNPDFKP